MKITLYTCSKCRHEWIGRLKKRAPKICPKCKRPTVEVQK